MRGSVLEGHTEVIYGEEEDPVMVSRIRLIKSRLRQTIIALERRYDSLVARIGSGHVPIREEQQFLLNCLCMVSKLRRLQVEVRKNFYKANTIEFWTSIEKATELCIGRQTKL